MQQPLDYLHYLKDYDWLIGGDRHEFHQIATQLYSQLTELSTSGNPPKIILAEPQPVKFLASFIAACAANCPVFLCNPNWGEQEWLQVLNLVQPNIILGYKTDYQYPIPDTQYLISNSIMIPTGGSSGKIKFAIHTWETLTASVQGFTEYFQIEQVNSFCVLPLYHVSGLMQFIRCFTTGGKLAIVPFKELEQGQTYKINPQEFFISLVPTQLQRLLQNPELTTWLSQFNTILLGGAPAGNELLEKAKYYNLRLAPTYGMTETASQIATLKPDDFLQGKFNNGKVLPHAEINIRNHQGEILLPNQTGFITVQSQSLALGYYPEIWKNQGYLQVDDLGFLDEEGYLNIVGRNSDKIITGGENVYPIEIESAILATEMVTDICVIGVPNEDWGQAITAIYIPKNNHISTEQIKEALSQKLSKFKIPKYWISLDTLPRNSQGKINRQELQKIANKFIKNHSVSQ